MTEAENMETLHAEPAAAAAHVDLPPPLRAALLDPVLWRQLLEPYAQVVQLAVALTDTQGRLLGTCINPQPLWQLVRAQHPAPPDACPFCLLPVPPCTGVEEAVRTKTVVTTVDRAGLTHFAVPLVLGDQPLGALIAGQVFNHYPDWRQLQSGQMAKTCALHPATFWQTARGQRPASRGALRTYGELLATVGGTFLQTRYHTLCEAERLAELRRAHEDLQASETRFRHLADAMPQIVWTARPDGTVEYANQRWYEFSGAPQDAGRPEDWLSLLHPEDRQLSTARWHEALTAGTMYQVESRLWHRGTGSYQWYLHRALPGRDAAGQIVRWFGTCTDIDAQKRTEVEFARSNAELQQFSYIVSHDLQEPLRTITSFVQLLERHLHGQLDAKAGEYIRFTVEGAQRMQVLLRDLRAYTHVGGSAQAFAAVDGEALLARVLGDLQLLIHDSAAEVSHDPFPVVQGDAGQLGLVLQNLIGNALKFRSAAAPRIHLAARRDETQWVFAVRDNGIGVDPQHAERIFAVFQRLHTSREYPGTGIGLAICKKIIERHGGRIWVESTPGQGATFFFTLAAEADAQAEAREGERTPQPGPASSTSGEPA